MNDYDYCCSGKQFGPSAFCFGFVWKYDSHYIVFVSLIDKPKVKIITINPYKISEGLEAKLECTVITANPRTGIIWKWIRTDNALNPVYNGSLYIIPNITKNESGSYSCTAANSAGISEPVMITVDVQCMYLNNQMWVFL